MRSTFGHSWTSTPCSNVPATSVLQSLDFKTNSWFCSHAGAVLSVKKAFVRSDRDFLGREGFVFAVVSRHSIFGSPLKIQHGGAKRDEVSNFSKHLDTEIQLVSAGIRAHHLADLQQQKNWDSASKQDQIQLNQIVHMFVTLYGAIFHERHTMKESKRLQF